MRKSKVKFCIIKICATTLLLFLLFCTMKEVDDPLSVSEFQVSESMNLHGSSGTDKDTFYRYETLFISLNGVNLQTQTQTEINIVNLADNSIVNKVVAITNMDGELENIPLWHYIGVNAAGAQVDESGSYTVHIQQANVNAPWNVMNVPFTVVNSVPPNAQVISTKADGSFAGGAVQIGGNLYAEGSGFGAGTPVQLTVVNNNSNYHVGDALTDVTGGVEIINSNGDGTLPNTQVWANVPGVGSYDLVADVAPFGQFNAGDAVADNILTGVNAQNPANVGDIITDVACNAAGMFSNVFNELDAIYAMVDPAKLPQTIVENATIYVCVHKDVWADGDPLVNIETVGSHAGGTHCLVDPTSGALAKHIIRGMSKPGYRQPVRLWPGDYDVIVDIGRNGVYNPGVDILDGGTQVGFTIPGTPPDVKFILSMFEDFTTEGQTTVRALVEKTGNSPVPGIAVTFGVGRGPGAINPSTAVTNGNGVAETLLTGLVPGEWCIVNAKCVVDGVQHVVYVSVRRSQPYVHNQGIVIGG